MNLEPCGVCRGVGLVYVRRPTTGPDGLERCTNCDGYGLVWTFGTWSVTFQRLDTLPPVRWRPTVKKQP